IHFDRRKLLQKGRHIEVVFGGMETDPRHLVAARQGVLIKRLVLVPEEKDRKRKIGGHDNYMIGKLDLETAHRFERYACGVVLESAIGLPRREDRVGYSKRHVIGVGKSRSQIQFRP